MALNINKEEEIMVYLIGFKSFIKKELWAGNFLCPHCNSNSDHHLAKHVNRAYVFFILVMSVAPQRFLMCDKCGQCTMINKKEYKHRYKIQWQSLLENTFPIRIIEAEYNPKTLKVWKSRLSVILTSIFAFMLVFSAIEMVRDIEQPDLSVPFGFVFMASIGILPLIFAIISFSRVNKKKKIYLLSKNTKE